MGFWKNNLCFRAIFLLLSAALSGIALSADAARLDEVKSKINQKNQDIAALEKEIREYEKKISTTAQEANTLSNAVKNLDATRQKIQRDISVTGSKIERTNLNIERLGIEIGTKETSIGTSKAIIGESMRIFQEADANSLIEILLKHETFSEFWNDLDTLENLQEDLHIHLDELRSRKEELQKSHNEASAYKKELVTLEENYKDQKRAADIARAEKNNLLKETKNKQSAYEALLEEKKRKKALFEQELASFEAELKEVLDPSRIPSARSGVLSWPTDKVTITQYFGNTPFATQNPGIYSGQGHNGIDLAAPIGTPIRAAREGRVLGTGDTDIVCRNASYGQWVFIEHDNGLSTLYAHLSFIKASSGQAVARGDIIGYSGNTGYSTGPHLHFTVFATEAVRIGELKSKVCGGGIYKIPLLTKTGGYLNPLSYLPQ